MSYEGKTDWKRDDVVKPEDMNRIEQGIYDAATKKYVDDSIQNIQLPGNSVQEVSIVTTKAQTVLSHLISTDSNFIVLVYFRVVKGQTSVSINISYTDAGGPQTLNLMPSKSFAVGSYALPAAFLHAIKGSSISISVTANVADQVFVSATVREA